MHIQLPSRHQYIVEDNSPLGSHLFFILINTHYPAATIRLSTMSDYDKNETKGSGPSGAYNASTREVHDEEVGIVKSDSLKKDLKGRHMQMIAIGGAIGAGLFIGSGGALSKGGPAALVCCCRSLDAPLTPANPGFC